MNATNGPLRRRNFLRTTACAVLCEPWWNGLVQSAAAQSAETPVGRVRVVLADFPALAAVNGSVYLTVAASPPGLYPVVLTRTAAEDFAAVTSECAHNGCVVQLYSPGAGVIQCNCHGSQYTAQGFLVRGPAQRNLTAYPVRRLGTHSLELEIPGIGFALAGAVVSGAAGNRLRLSFATVAGLRYAVRQRSTLTGGDTGASFSLTVEGAFNQTQLTGTGAEAVIFLPPPTETVFYALVRQS